uniref:Ependymin-like 1 n=1 Tax=Seriola dumerili TaxID=41447 RepID=A0A3B4U6M1_SERDU
MNFISVLSCLNPCEAISIFLFTFYSVSLFQMAGNGLFMSTGTITYDAFGQRMRVRNYGFSGNQTFGVDQLMLFNQKVYYEIDWSKLSCKKKALDTSFIPMHVPSDAKLMGQVFLGSSSSFGMGVLVNTWYGDLPHNGKWEHCARDKETWLYLDKTTFNWVLGNTNPMDYTPPFFCAKSKLEETETPDTVFTALKSLAVKTKNEE